MSLEIIHAGIGQHRHQHHPVFGQGARFIRADDIGRPQGLDCGEPVNQGITARHPPHATRQSQGCNNRQALGNGRYREGNGGLDHQVEIPAPHQPGDQGEGGDAQGDDDELATQASQPFFQRGVSSSCVVMTREEIMPNSVFRPVATTTAVAEPRASEVPL